MTTTLSSNYSLLLRRLLIATLAGLLIFYHLLTLYELYLAGSPATLTSFDHIQSALRLGISISLTLVVFGVRVALIGMWLCISGLVATHYWAHFGNLPVDFTAGRHPLSYLKGFIFPTLITLAFVRTGKRNDADSNAKTQPTPNR